MGAYSPLLVLVIVTKLKGDRPNGVKYLRKFVLDKKIPSFISILNALLTVISSFCISMFDFKT